MKPRQETAFLAALKENPDDEATRLVFADWLEDQNDPRAAWVRDAELWPWMKPNAKDPFKALSEAITKNSWRGSTARRVIVKLGSRGVRAALDHWASICDDRTAWGIGYEFEQGMPGLPATPETLADLLEYSRHPQLLVRRTALHGLRQLQKTYPEAQDRLIESLADSDHHFVAMSCVHLAAADTIQPKALPALIAVLQQQHSSFARNVALPLEKLGPLAAPAAEPLLNCWVASPHDDIAKALSAIGVPILPWVEKAIDTLDSRLLYKLVHILIGMGPVVTEPMKEWLHHPKSCVIHVASRVLAHYGSIDVIPALCRSLREGTAIEQVAAAGEFGRFETLPSEAMPDLLLALADPNRLPEARARIAYALEYASPKDPAVVRVLLGAVKREDNPAEVCQAAGLALEELGYAASALLLSLHHGLQGRVLLWEGTRSVIYALIFGSRRQPPLDQLRPLIKTLREEGGNTPEIREIVRLAVIEPAPKAVPELVNHLKDKEFNHRLLAVLGLWHVRTEEAIVGLVLALQDRHKLVRLMAVTALGRIGHRSAEVVEAVTKLRSDSVSMVAEAARSALVQLTDSSTGE